MVTATIQPNSRRDVTTGDPKVLLLDVYLNGELFRDHLWVSEEPFKHLKKKCVGSKIPGKYFDFGLTYHLMDGKILPIEYYL